MSTAAAQYVDCLQNKEVHFASAIRICKFLGSKQFNRCRLGSSKLLYNFVLACCIVLRFEPYNTRFQIIIIFKSLILPHFYIYKLYSPTTLVFKGYYFHCILVLCIFTRLILHHVINATKLVPNILFLKH